MMKKVMFILFVLSFAVIQAQAETKFYSWANYDEGVPIIVRYTRTGAHTGTIQVTSAAIITGDDGIYTTNALGGATVATIVAGINAGVNSDSEKWFEAKAWGATTADTIADSDLLTLAATTLEANAWNYGVKWDSSVDLHYDVVVSTMLGSSMQTPKSIERILGFPSGTGAITLTVYSGDTVKWKEVITSPIYTHSAAGTTETFAADEDTPARINKIVDIQLAAGKRAWIRAARATTATQVGGIGAVGKQ
jgi:hypothetical protein